MIDCRGYEGECEFFAVSGACVLLGGGGGGGSKSMHAWELFESEARGFSRTNATRLPADQRRRRHCVIFMDALNTMMDLHCNFPLICATSELINNNISQWLFSICSLNLKIIWKIIQPSAKILFEKRRLCCFSTFDDINDELW